MIYLLGGGISCEWTQGLILKKISFFFCLAETVQLIVFIRQYFSFFFFFQEKNSKIEWNKWAYIRDFIKFRFLCYSFSRISFLFCSYSLLHASRKTFSNVKVSISKQWTPSAFNKSIRLPVEVSRANARAGSGRELCPPSEFLSSSSTLFHSSA